MICLKHCSTVSLLYMLTILQSATVLTIRQPPMPSRREGQKDIDEVVNWSSSIKMLLNEYKTKSMLVRGKRLVKKMDHSSLQLHLKSSQLNQVHSQKLLGVTIDSQLSFDQHVDDLYKKLAQRIAVLRKIRRSVPLDQRKLYYNAMIKQTWLQSSDRPARLPLFANVIF